MICCCFCSFGSVSFENIGLGWFELRQNGNRTLRVFFNFKRFLIYLVNIHLYFTHIESLTQRSIFCSLCIFFVYLHIFCSIWNNFRSCFHANKNKNNNKGSSRTFELCSLSKIYFLAGETYLVGCKEAFTEDHRFANQWHLREHLFSYSTPQEGKENECALRCLVEYYNRCHFYTYIRDYCFYGDFDYRGGPTYTSDNRPIRNTASLESDENDAIIRTHPYLDEYFGKSKLKTLFNFLPIRCF